MVRALRILAIILLTTFKGFGQTNTTIIKVDHYKTKQFDIAIFPANYLALIPGQRFTPTRQEIDKAEAALQNNIKNLNQRLVNQSSTPVIHKNLHKYKRQYFGYVDKNGDRILLVNCFWSKDKERNNNWLMDRVMALDGGSYYWNIKFNLDKGEFFELDVNGYA